MYAFQNESTLYSWLNVKELLAQSRPEIYGLSDCEIWSLSEKVYSCKIKNQQDARDAFYLTFGFFGYKAVKKWTMNLFKSSEDFGFSNFIWLNWKV